MKPPLEWLDWMVNPDRVMPPHTRGAAFAVIACGVAVVTWFIAGFFV